MKKIFIFLAVCRLLLPNVSLAAVPKIYSGALTAILGTQLQFSTAAGVYYSAQAQNVSLIRRYGGAMEIGEFLIGDKIQVTGLARPDNSIAASLIRDMFLYAHSGTFTGKITALSPLSGYLEISSRQWGQQAVHATSYTAFKKNSVSATIADLAAGMTVRVKGIWERSSKNLAASSVEAIIRLVNIEISGRLVLRGDTALTVIANNTIYGIDAAGAFLVNKNGRPITVDQLGMDDILRITGKHISGSAEIAAGKIRDTDR